MVGVIATPSYTMFMVKILAEFSEGEVKADVQKNKISVKLFSLKKKKLDIVWCLFALLNGSGCVCACCIVAG